MKNVKISEYIYFGTSLRYLQDVDEHYPIKGDGCILENIKSFLENLELVNLPVTIRGSADLIDFKNKISKKRTNNLLSAIEINELKEITKDIRNILFAESSGAYAYIVTDKRIAARKLMEEVHSLMSPGVFASIPDIAKFDFSQSGRCIAFELPTSAAFHLLRGTEAVLKQLYYKKVKRNRIKPLTWGGMTNDLKTKSNPPPADLIANLDNIRVTYRNPTQHPEKIYDIEEVQDLFSLCVEITNRMHRYISSLK